jgi:hypothetical protein
MDHQKLHLFEKIQVQLAVLVLGLAVYVGLWPLVSPPDAAAPLALLSISGFGATLAAVLGLWLLALLAGGLTLHMRPSAGMVVAVLAFGGLALRSEKINVLLWRNGPGGGGAFGPLIIEQLVLLVALVVASQLAAVGRALAARIRPGWVWQPPRAKLAAPVEQSSLDLPAWMQGVLLFLAGRLVVGRQRLSAGRVPEPFLLTDGPDAPTAREIFTRLGLGLLTALIASQVLLFLLAQSDQRGQILFALGASFFLAALAGNLLYPTRLYAAYAILPLLVGVGHYIYGTSAVVTTWGGWAQLPITTRALPIDWTTLGAGGALAGFWVASRIREAKWFEKQQEIQAKAEPS